MKNPYIDDNDDLPTPTPQSPPTSPYYEFGSGPRQPASQRYNTAPGQFQPEPLSPPPLPARAAWYPARGGMRTGAIIALAVVLAVVFGTGLFAGWQFGRTSNSSNSNSGSVATLQPGNTPAVTVPQLTGNNIEAVREAVVAKVRPAVVQVNVTLQNGNAIGSGVIIDGRGYIVTNNHVVNGAQTLNVVLYDGTHLSAQVAGTNPLTTWPSSR